VAARPALTFRVAKGGPGSTVVGHLRRLGPSRFYGKHRPNSKAPPLLTGLCLRSSRSAAYLLVAHIYMLISIPTDTSTIFGAFQAILATPFFQTSPSK
jgi:hypothetical protein